MLEHDPAFPIQGIWVTNDVFVGMNYDTGQRVTVDGSNGKVLGDFNADEGVLGTTLAFFTNFHDCLLSCEDMPGYQSWLLTAIPGTGWLGFDGEEMTIAGLLIGLTALLLLFLAVSGVWLWWPGLKRWFVGVRVRMSRGRYARDYDLHQVAGMIAIPLLAHLGSDRDGIRVRVRREGVVCRDARVERRAARLRVQEVDRSRYPTIGGGGCSDRGGQEDIAQRTRACRPRHAGEGRQGRDVHVLVLARARPVFPRPVSGELGINVDRRDASRTALTYGSPDRSKAQLVWEDYNYTVHAGLFVGPWLRLFWLVLGLVPLLLAITGVSTWLYKRGARKRRRSEHATAATAA